MNLYVLMRLLESAPQCCELGIHFLTLGRLERIYNLLATNINAGERIFDLGCGTGLIDKVP